MSESAQPSTSSSPRRQPPQETGEIIKVSPLGDPVENHGVIFSHVTPQDKINTFKTFSTEFVGPELDEVEERIGPAVEAAFRRLNEHPMTRSMSYTEFLTQIKQFTDMLTSRLVDEITLKRKVTTESLSMQESVPLAIQIANTVRNLEHPQQKKQNVFDMLRALDLKNP